MKFIQDLENGSIPMYTLPAPQNIEVKFPRYDGPLAGPVKTLTPEEYFEAKKREAAQGNIKVAPTR